MDALIIFTVSDENSTTMLSTENDLKVLTSPGYLNYYPPNTYIIFTVYSPEGSNVKLDFLDLDIEYYCDDPIHIYDGKSYWYGPGPGWGHGKSGSLRGRVRQIQVLVSHVKKRKQYTVVRLTFYNYFQRIIIPFPLNVWFFNSFLFNFS